MVHKTVVDCDSLCAQVENANMINRSIERGLLKAGERVEANVSILSK